MQNRKERLRRETDSLLHFVQMLYKIRPVLKKDIIANLIGTHRIYHPACKDAQVASAKTLTVAREKVSEEWVLRGCGRAYPYAVAATLSWCFLLFSNVFFFIHLALMWLRLGRRSSHPTLLGHAHHDDLHDAAHGPEGDIDTGGPGSMPSHSH